MSRDDTIPRSLVLSPPTPARHPATARQQRTTRSTCSGELSSPEEGIGMELLVYIGYIGSHQSHGKHTRTLVRFVSTCIKHNIKVNRNGIRREVSGLCVWLWPKSPSQWSPVQFDVQIRNRILEISSIYTRVRERQIIHLRAITIKQYRAGNTLAIMINIDC